MVTLADKLNAIAESEATAKQTQPESKELKMNVVKVEKPETKPETHEATTTTENENNNGENNNTPDDTGDNETKGE